MKLILRLVLGIIYLFEGVLATFAESTPRACPKDYVYYDQGHKCYRHYDTPKAWYEARKHCQREGSDMVVVPDRRTSSYINTLLTPDRGMDFEEIWLGLKEISDQVFRWSDGSPAVYSEWKKREPSNDVIKGSDCSVLEHPSHPKWNDESCNTPKPYVCQKLPEVFPACPTGYACFPAQKKCVKAFHDTPLLGWDDARDVCRLDGGDLVVMAADDRVYTAFVKTLLQRGYPYWISTVFCLVFSSPAGNTTGLDDVMGRAQCNSSNRFICERSYAVPVSCGGGGGVGEEDDYYSYSHRSGWVLNGKTKKCYRLQNETKTFHESKTECQRLGGDLASVDDDKESRNYVMGLIDGLGARHWVNHHPAAKPWPLFCRGRVLDSPPALVQHDRCDTRYASVCERLAVRRRGQPVLECPRGYTTYVTTTTGEQITCVMTESNQKKTMKDARAECQISGGDLFDFDSSETDIISFIGRTFLPFSYQSIYWNWGGSNHCMTYISRENAVPVDTCPSTNNYVCQQWGIITDVVQLRNIRHMIGKNVHDSSLESESESESESERSNNAPLVDVCRASEMAQLYNLHEWIRNSSRVSLMTDKHWTSFIAQHDNIMSCLYTEGRDCCVEAAFSAFTKDSHSTTPPVRMKITFPTDKLRCLCPNQEVKETVKLLKNLTSHDLNSSAVAPNKLCPCSCDSAKINRNPSPTEMATILSRIHHELKVNPRQLALKRSQKTSAQDNRIESRVIGCAGVILCLIPVCILLAIDVTRLVEFIKGLNNNNNPLRPDGVVGPLSSPKTK